MDPRLAGGEKGVKNRNFLAEVPIAILTYTEFTTLARIIITP
jgi:hypothetical protein